MEYLGQFLALGIVFAAVTFALVIIVYIWSGIQISKVLRMLGYQKSWMAWIPLANYYALADAIKDENNNITAFGRDINYLFFAFFWIIGLVLSYIPRVGTLLNLTASIIGLGSVFSTIYSRLEDKKIKDTLMIGLISGLIPIVALIKFTGYKEEEKED